MANFKMLLIIFTIAAASVFTGMVSFTIYYVVISHGKSTGELSVEDQKLNMLSSEGYELMQTFDNISNVEATYFSKLAIEKTEASELNSSTAINKYTLGLSMPDLDTSGSSSKGYTPVKTHTDKISVENISNSQIILARTEPLELESTTRITKSINQECFKDCQTTRRPVCGTNNETYSNECILEVAACKAQDRNLTMAYKGSCRIRIGTSECCSEIKVDSQGARRYFWETLLGSYKFHSIFNERPMYKGVRSNTYISWNTTNTWGAWVVTGKWVNNPTFAALYTTCNENCVEDCFSGHWYVSDGHNWINDDTVIIECNSNTGHDVDPCKENKPLKILHQKTGVISPSSIQNSSRCEWHIKADTGYIIKLTVLEFNFKGGDMFVEVHDGSSASESRIGVLSENLAPTKDPLFSTGPEIYITFSRRIPNSKLATFKLRYNVEKCDWNDWEIGECSSTCEGGYQSKTRKLINVDQNVTNCGSSTVTEPCNLESCTDSICKEFEISSLFFQGTFTLQNFTSNAKPVYMSSHGDYLYSSKDAWVISPYVGSNVRKKRSAICYDEETPAGCNVWLFKHEGRNVFDSSAKTICKHFI